MAAKGLSVELKVGDSISLDFGRVVITVEKKTGQVARLRVVAQEEVKIETVRARPADFAEVTAQAS